MMDSGRIWCTRAPVAGDLNFITDSWVESYRKHGCSSSQRPFDGVRPSSVDPRIYTAEQHALVARTLVRPDTRVLIACDAEDPNQIIGYVVYGEPRSNITHTDPRVVFQYVYTKTLFRRMGIARKLIREAAASRGAGWATHWHPLLRELFDPIEITYCEYYRG